MTDEEKEAVDGELAQYGLSLETVTKEQMLWILAYHIQWANDREELLRHLAELRF